MGSLPGDWHPRLPDRIPPPPAVSVDYFDVGDAEVVGDPRTSTVSVGTVTEGEWSYLVALERPDFPAVHTGVRERFAAAAAAWAGLDHPHVVGVLGHGVDPGPWLALEYVDAGALPDRELPLELPEVLWVGRSLADATVHAHGAGVTHRAIRPGSVLFGGTPDDAWPIPKVAGWKVAEAVADVGGDLGRRGAAYRAPEQVDPELGRPTERTDVYRLGAVCYLLATGEAPFSGTPRGLRDAILAGDPVAPSTHVPGLPGELGEVILGAMATDPDDRYGSATALREAFEGLIDAYEAGRIDASSGTADVGGAPGGTGGAGGTGGTGSEVPAEAGTGEDTAPRTGEDVLTLDRRTALVAGAGVVGLAAVSVGASTLLSGGPGAGTDGEGPDERPAAGGRAQNDTVTRDGASTAAVSGLPPCEEATDASLQVGSVTLEKRPEDERVVLQGEVRYRRDGGGETPSNTFAEVVGTFFDGDGQSLGVRVEAMYIATDGPSTFRLVFAEEEEWQDVDSYELNVNPQACY